MVKRAGIPEPSDHQQHGASDAFGAPSAPQALALPGVWTTEVGEAIALVVSSLYIITDTLLAPSLYSFF